MSTDYQPDTQRRVGDYWHANVCKVLVLSVALVGSWASTGAAHVKVKT